MELLVGLGLACPLQELKLHSNMTSPNGAFVFVHLLNDKFENSLPVMLKLNRIHMSYNKLGNQGIAKLTMAISKRAKIGMTEVSLSGNRMGSKGMKSIMNKFLQHKRFMFNLNNSTIGYQGCQLVAASLPNTPYLFTLNLVFNTISY